MKALYNIFNLILNFENTTKVAIDKNHALQILGSVVSKKPENILEVGIGTGFITKTLFYGILYNNIGKLTCVDNWYDFGGVVPNGIEELEDAGINIINSNEYDFVKTCKDNTYDFLVSDGDHHNSGTWVDEYLRIVKNDGFMYFHDTNNKYFKNMGLVESRIKELNIPYFQFKTKTRTDENCDIGLLFAINKK